MGDLLGFAKYHEDNLAIIDERMYYRNGTSLPSAKESYTSTTPKIEFKYFCPFCKSGYETNKDLIDHILLSHGGVHEFVYLNNRRINDGENTVKQVYSLKLYCFRDSAKKICLQDNIGNEYSFWTKPVVNEYDIQSILLSKVYSEIIITNIDSPVCIKQQLDINIVSIKKIFSGKYMSYFFDEQISEEMLSLEECLIYIKMLIYEGADTEPFIVRLGCMNLDKSRELDELYYYYFLQKGSFRGIEDRILSYKSSALLEIISGNYSDAEKILSEISGSDNDKYGCLIILGLLKNESLRVDYLKKLYNPYGFIGMLEQVLYHFYMYEKEDIRLPINEINEIELFSKYPLIHALVEFNNTINKRGNMSYQSYTLLRELTPLAAINYCYSIDNELERERILKSMMKIHKNSTLIKEFAYENDYRWMQKRIFVSDGNLYRKAVIRQNEKYGGVFSQYYMDEFPYDDQIIITSLGGEHDIGASCYVISYHGYHIMLDCGINTQKYGDDAYPKLDTWNKEIDAIIISHAHVDHSGGVPKAHAMWPEANIISTQPTKVFVKYLYSDMAKVKNGIVNDFEIENVAIEKEVMLDTLNSMTTIGYEEWINLYDNIKICLHCAGHIIGAAMIELQIDGKTILYTGDFCNYSQLLSTEFDISALPKDVDYFISEATYLKKTSIDWSKQHEDLRIEIIKGIKEGKAILLPAASIGRSQELVCIIGEMKLKGEIPDGIRLYLGGMAIPATTQIIPFMNKRYEKIISLFEEFDSMNYPEQDSVVIASSGTMIKGSASYEIAKYWSENEITYLILANGYLDEESEMDYKHMDQFGNVQRISLSTHADVQGILEVIDYVSPKVISFVHHGSKTDEDLKLLINTCRGKFLNDILYKELYENRGDRVFDLYNWFLEGVDDHV